MCACFDFFGQKTGGGGGGGGGGEVPMLRPYLGPEGQVRKRLCKMTFFDLKYRAVDLENQDFLGYHPCW